MFATDGFRRIWAHLEGASRGSKARANRRRVFRRPLGIEAMEPRLTLTVSGAPFVTSIARLTPAGALTNADSLVFQVTFNEFVTGVSGDDDFDVTGTTAGITGVLAVSPKIYNLTVFGGDLASFNGAVGLNIQPGTDIEDTGEALALVQTEPPIDDTYLVDNTAPSTTSFKRQTPLAEDTNADTLVFRATFSEAVSGVNAADFDPTGTSASATSVAYVTGSNFTQYDVTVSGGDLAGFTGTVGLNLVGSPTISDAAGNALPATEPTPAANDETYDLDNIAPTADIIDVTPDPRNTAVGVVTIQFSEDVTGVDIADFTLTRNAASVDISALSVSTVDANTYTIDLSTVTGLAGEYELTLVAAGSGITDGVGNALAVNALDDWTTDLTPPTADIVNVSPDPRTTDAGTVTINFSESVTGVDISDFTLTRSGAAVDISSLSVGGGGSSYTIDLSTVTTADGKYFLQLIAPGGITDAASNAFATSVSDQWTKDATAPTADIVDVAPDPRNTVVGIVTINFSENVTGVDIADFTLTRNASNVSLSGLVVTQVNPKKYTLDLSSKTGTAGVYELTLVAAGSGNQDGTGNALAVNAFEEWELDTTLPLADVVNVTPDPHSGPVGVVTINFTESVIGVNISDFTLLRRDGTFVDISGLTVLGSGSSRTIDLTTVTATPDRYALTLVASGSGILDLAGNALSTNAADVFTVVAPPILGKSSSASFAAAVDEALGQLYNAKKKR